MAYFSILAFATILTYFGLRSPFWYFKILSGLGWLGFGIFVIGSPPSGVTSGSVAHTILITVSLGFTVGCWLYAFGRESEYTEHDGKKSVLRRVFRIRGENNSNHRETPEEYRERMYRAKTRGRSSIPRR